MIKVILTDDHSVIRKGLRGMLELRPDIEIIGEAGDGKELMGLLQSMRPDLIIMDVTMPEMNGIEASRKISSLYPEIKLICMSMHEEPQIIKDIADAGVKAYLLKDTGQEELFRAIDAVMKGRKYFNEQIFDILIQHEAGSHTQVQLTEKEKEILKLICEELTNHEISEKLSISVRTVDTHRRNLLQKLEVKNTAGLVKYAIKTGLI